MLRRFPLLYLRWLIISTCLIASIAKAGSAQDVFTEYKKAIYQIRVIELSSGKKSSIGSGFQIKQNGLIATNFHVISEAVHKPEKYRLEYINHKGDKGELSIQDIDVIHDLALVKHNDTHSTSIELSADDLNKGEGIYSIGNPLDLGMIVIQGTYSGLIENSFYERILFSGSLNAGMSGGPALNSNGNVIGINVATSGNQISFLVPVRHLRELTEHLENNTQAPDFKERITQQLLDDQSAKFNILLNSPWPKDSLGKTTIFGEIASFTRCWGDTNDNKENLYAVTYSRCSSNDSIYISNSFTTGKLDYEFYLFSTDQLSPMRFYARYQNAFGPIFSSNQATKEDVTNFQCIQNYVSNHASSKSNTEIAPPWNSLFCSRAYKKYPGVYDVMFINAYLGENNQGLITHFSLTGISKENSIAFTRQFMEHIQWN